MDDVCANLVGKARLHEEKFGLFGSFRGVELSQSRETNGHRGFDISNTPNQGKTKLEPPPIW
jgi:hypothetical protein